jgi:mono/diheme cytochrome c family protein
MLRRVLAVVALPATLVAADEPKPKAGPSTIALVDLKRTDAVAYDKEIAPLFAAKCQACHAGKITEGKLDLSTYAGLMKGGETGPAVVANKPDDSRLFLLAGHRKKPVMPPKADGDPFTPQELSLLRLWIAQGAKPPAVDGRVVRAVVLSLPPALVKPVRAVAVSPDKNTVAAGRGNQVHLFDAKTGELKHTLVDPTLKTGDGQPANAAHVSLVESMTYSPDGKTIATGSFREVTLWDVDRREPTKRIGGFADRVVAIAYSPDGKLIATGGGAPTEDGEIKLFDAAGTPAGEVKNGHSDTVFGVCFSPDGKLLATAGADKFVKVFEVPGGKLAKSFEGHTGHVLDVGWTPDGKKLVSCGADSDKMVKVWDYEKGEKVRDLTTNKLQATRMAFVPKSPQFLLVGGDGVAKVWNADNGGQMKNFDGAKDYLYAAAVSGDGKLVATGGEDGVVRVYNGENGQIVKQMTPTGAEPKK